MKKDAKIFVSHHKGMIGSALVRKLKEKGFDNFVFLPSEEWDEKSHERVHNFFQTEKPDYVFLVAAQRSGIMANKLFPADLFHETIQMEMLILHSAFKSGVKKLLFLGSSNAYPQMALQPIKETELMTGGMEPSQEATGLSTLVGLKYCEYLNQQKGTNYISAIAAGMYGKNDYYHPSYSHVVPGLLRRFHEAKVNQDPVVYVWGTGSAIRDFLYADDIADACVFLMNYYEGNDRINIGSGKDVTIKELAQSIQRVVGYEGKVIYDKSKPVGMPRKMLDVSKLTSMGWTYDTELEEGLHMVYEDLMSKSIEWKD